MGPAASSPSMTETEMSPLEAAAALAKARTYEDDLRCRTSGLTWMIWGLVTPGIFLSYAFAAVVGADGPLVSFLWAPWIAAGVLATSALWRSVALSTSSLRGIAWRAFWLRFALVTLAYAVVLRVFPIDRPSAALLLVGLTWTAMGALGLWRPRPGVATSGVAIWAGLLTAGLGLALVLARLPIEVEGTVSIVASGAIPFGAGLWQTIRA